MTVRNRARPPRGEVSEVVFSHLLPDEDQAEYRQFRDALIGELAPRGVYQRHLAANLVDIEWDIQRHRRLLAATLRSEFARQAGGIAESGRPGLPMLIPGLGDDVSFGKRLLSNEPEAQAELRALQVSMSEITAAAANAVSEIIGYHETRIADLEHRRRRLLADYERLQERQNGRGPIEDAEEVP